MSEPCIRVLKVTHLPGDRPLKGFVDIEINGWVLRDWRVIQPSGGPVEVLCPQCSYRDQKGIVRYRSLLTLPPELYQRICVEILNSWWGKETNGGKHHST